MYVYVYIWTWHDIILLLCIYIYVYLRTCLQCFCTCPTSTQTSFFMPYVDVDTEPQHREIQKSWAIVESLAERTREFGSLLDRSDQDIATSNPWKNKSKIHFGKNLNHITNAKQKYKWNIRATNCSWQFHCFGNPLFPTNLSQIPPSYVPSQWRFRVQSDYHQRRAAGVVRTSPRSCWNLSGNFPHTPSGWVRGTVAFFVQLVNPPQV